uniref:BolA-like protein 3 n=1 Tax=Caligus rogercresseyi TaxID=217165 RepID=C1BRD9_CALRO|nr:BolA-like protein 3 [Caligus rogercresseyi]
MLSRGFRTFSALRYLSEAHVTGVLNTSFPKATAIAVKDISHGCGPMFEIYVEAPEFSGLKMVKQHKLVSDALRKEIKDMHGLRISTSVSQSS